MKNLLIILFLMSSIPLYGSVSIVSDLDDTIKITNSDDSLEGAYNAALRSDVFTGISEFFMGATTYSNSLHVLSASPTVLKAKIESTLRKRRIDTTSIILKNPLLRESKFDYKVKAIKSILEKNPDDLILIGDDVGQDPEAYAEIQRQYPNRILAIYIHVIKNRTIESGYQYWTSFDLFLREFVAGRMTPGWLEHGIKTVLSERNVQKMIPHFAHCPRLDSAWSWQLGTIYAQEALVLGQRLQKYCQARSSGIAGLQ